MQLSVGRAEAISFLTFKHKETMQCSPLGLGVPILGGYRVHPVPYSSKTKPGTKALSSVRLHLPPTRSNAQFFQRTSISLVDSLGMKAILYVALQIG